MTVSPTTIAAMKASGTTWSDDGGYVYRMQSDGSVLIVSSPRGGAGTVVQPGSAAYTAIVEAYAGRGLVKSLGTVVGNFWTQLTSALGTAAYATTSGYETNPRISGVSYASSKVIISAPAKGFLVRLRAALDPTVPIVVTEGFRTYAQQADRMATKYQLGGAAELYAVYDDALIDELLAAPRDQWVSIVTAAYNDGRLSKAGHTTGYAVDLQIRDLSESQIAKLQTAVAAVGAKWLRESAPPHAHVTIPAVSTATAVGGSGAMIAVLLVAGWYAWRKRWLRR